MAVEALNAGLDVSPVTVGYRLFRRSQQARPGDENGGASANGHDHQNEQKPPNCPARLGSRLTETQVTPSLLKRRLGLEAVRCSQVIVLAGSLAASTCEQAESNGKAGIIFVLFCRRSRHATTRATR